MSKQRTTRDTQPKVAEKKSTRASKKTKLADSASSSSDSTAASVNGRFTGLSAGEVNVLTIFKKYLMGPGQMLCLSNTDIDSSKIVFEKLVNAGLLVAEDFKGGYSLTQTGYKAMHEVGQ